MEIETPIVVLIFGNNCAGKSTVGRELAARFTKGAFIEVDELKYKIVGGLLRGPWEAKQMGRKPAAFVKQRLIADENAVILARNFATHGFSSVIEGLEDSHRPGTGWSESQFGTLPVIQVLLMCDEETSQKRLTERGWEDHHLRPGFKRNRAWYLEHQYLFDLTVRTDKNSSEEAAELIFDAAKKLQR